MVQQYILLNQCNLQKKKSKISFTQIEVLFKIQKHVRM